LENRAKFAKRNPFSNKLQLTFSILKHSVKVELANKMQNRWAEKLKRSNKLYLLPEHVKLLHRPILTIFVLYLHLDLTFLLKQLVILELVA